MLQIIYSFLFTFSRATYLPQGCKCQSSCDPQGNCFLTPETRDTCPFVETDGTYWWTRCIEDTFLEVYDPREILNRSWVDCFAQMGWIPHPCSAPEVTAFYAEEFNGTHNLPDKIIPVRLNLLRHENWCTQKYGRGPDDYGNCLCKDEFSCIGSCTIDNKTHSSWFDESCTTCSCTGSSSPSDNFDLSIQKMNEIWPDSLHFERAKFQTANIDAINIPNKTKSDLSSGIGFDTSDAESMIWLYDLFNVSRHQDSPSPYLEAFVIEPKIKDTLAITIARHMGGSQNFSSAIFISYDGGFDNELAAWQNFAHESGHLLGLFHTFEGLSKIKDTDVCPICTAMENDWTTGDFIPDTLATGSTYEPGNVLPIINNDTADCHIEFNSTGACRVLPGGVGNTHNLMSYDEYTCRNSFSKMQLARMRCFADMTFQKESDAPSSVYLQSSVQQSPSGNCQGLMVYIFQPVTELYCTECMSEINIEKRVEGDTSWVHLGNVSLSTRSYLDEEVIPGQDYTYRAMALNANGWGPVVMLNVEYPMYCNETHPETTTEPPKSKKHTDRSIAGAVIVSILFGVIILTGACYWCSNRKSPSPSAYRPMINT